MNQPAKVKPEGGFAVSTFGPIKLFDLDLTDKLSDGASPFGIHCADRGDMGEHGQMN